MELSLQPFVGVIVSVALFLLAYRTTIGARKERIRAANTDLEKTLLKRIVLESYQPTVTEVRRFIEGKAQDYRVRTRDLLTELQILTALFARVLETDLITSRQREAILGKLFPLLQKAEDSPLEKARVVEHAEERKPLHRRTIVTLVPIALLASVTGTLLVLTSAIMTGAPVGLLKTGLLVFTASTLAILLVLLVLRIREAQEESGSTLSLKAGITFEEEVVWVLQKGGARLKLGEPRPIGGDFMAEIRGKQLLIAVKPWIGGVPISLVRAAVDQLREGLKEESADLGILVVMESLPLPLESLEDAQVRVMTIRQLRNYLAYKLT